MVSAYTLDPRNPTPHGEAAADPYGKQLILEVYALLRVPLLATFAFKGCFLSSRNAAKHLVMMQRAVNVEVERKVAKNALEG
jgi:hypothetical protein